MTAPISNELQMHLDGELTTRAQMVWLKTQAGTVYAFTGLDRDVVFEGVRYRADASVSATQISNTADTSVDNLSISGLLADLQGKGNLTELDVLSGVFDNAQYRVFYVNWSDLSMGAVDAMYGNYGETSVHDGQYESNISGITEKLTKTVGSTTCVTCPWIFGGTECGYNREATTKTGTVISVPDSAHIVCADAAITALPDNWGVYGKIVWTSGLNAGRESSVRASSGGTITLWEPMAIQAAVGDGFTLYEGCDNQASTCKTKNNYQNFLGFEYVPSQDQVNRYA